MSVIARATVVVGMEVHIELACRTKVFSRALSPAGFGHAEGGANECIDALVLGLPGSLPVLNAEAVRMSIAVGLALNCAIAPLTRWDRKGYFYPDMPKGYQISQYDVPLCSDGFMDVPAPVLGGGDAGPIAVDEGAEPVRVGIIRAHLEEDAGKLLHEAPGGGAIGHSIVDLNRAGTALLEVVTKPDFRSAQSVVLFCQQLRGICMALGVTRGVMQRGHMRFEPNINCELTLDDGRVVKTPIVEVKNLNSFKAVRGAIEFEARQQPARWLADGREMGAGTKQTRGWDDRRGATFVQRQKEDAHDYRYFPDPDLLPVVVSEELVQSVRRSLPELPVQRRQRYREAFGLGPKEASALSADVHAGAYLDAVVEHAVAHGVPAQRAGKAGANLILNTLFRIAPEDVPVSELGITPSALAGVVVLRDKGDISAQSADDLLVKVREGGGATATGEQVAQLAKGLGMIRVRDAGAMQEWVEQAIAGNPQAAADVRAGKDPAIGRLVGAAMKLAGGQADAAELRSMIQTKLRG